MFSQNKNVENNELNEVVEFKGRLSENLFHIGDTVQLKLSYKNVSSDEFYFCFPNFVFLMEVMEEPVFRGGMMKSIREESECNEWLSLASHDSINIQLDFVVDKNSFYFGRRAVCIYVRHIFQPKKSCLKKDINKNCQIQIYGGVLQSEKFFIDVKESVH